jgi:tripartite-type tricarboxylate transporter receptor subunit TctC
MTDVIARAVGAELSKRLASPVVVENRVGADGIVATNYVAGSPPDGYTLLMTLPAPVSSYFALYSKLPYDPRTQLRMISDIALPRVVVAVHPSVPASDVSSLLEAIRASPHPYAMGSWGLGTQAHMIQSFLTREYGLQILHVVYKGESAMVADLLGGTIQMTAGSLAALGPQIQAGKLKPIALLGSGRSAMLPTLATFEEQGYGDAVYTFRGPVSLMGPSKTPDAIVARLGIEVQAIVASPEIARQIRAIGADPVGNSPAEADAAYRRFVPMAMKLVKDTGVSLD